MKKECMFFFFFGGFVEASKTQMAKQKEEKRGNLPKKSLLKEATKVQMIKWTEFI